jgi:TolB-like protein
VANILEGSVRREGNHVRITADLIKADDGFQLWSQTYDREINDIFLVKSDWLIKNLRQDPPYTELLKKMHLSR